MPEAGRQSKHRAHQLRFAPLVGVLVAICLIGVAAFWFPGGYDWNRTTVSALCASHAPNGDPNPSRGFAAAGLLVLCVSKAMLFQAISRQGRTLAEQKVIQVAGIGSMVYVALTATPMHNLMINIGLAFYVTAMGAILYMLFRRRSLALFFIGLVCFAVLIANASIYYANVFGAFWGMKQKLSFAVCTTWLFAVQFDRQSVIQSSSRE